MTFGLYKHYKGGWYLGLWKVWESTNYQVREEKVLYYSFKKRTFNVRSTQEFFGTVPYQIGYDEFRFLKFTLFRESCYCRELGAYEKCPRHGSPQYGNHMQLKRFDGKEHESDPYRDIKSAVDKLDKEGHLK